jgi:hypothetical protein
MEPPANPARFMLMRYTHLKAESIAEKLRDASAPAESGKGPI